MEFETIASFAYVISDTDDTAGIDHKGQKWTLYFRSIRFGSRYLLYCFGILKRDEPVKIPVEEYRIIAKMSSR